MAEHGSGEHAHSPHGGPSPTGIVETADPSYPVGTMVILAADQMSGNSIADPRISGESEC